MSKTLDVEITLIKAEDVKDVSIMGGLMGGNLDPYLLVKCQSQAVRSSTAKGNGTSPVWNEVLPDKLLGIHQDSIVTFQLYDENNLRFRHKSIGAATAKLSELMGPPDKVYELSVTKKGQPDKQRGTLHLRVSTTPSAAPLQEPNPKFRVQSVLDGLPAGRPGLWIFGETEPLDSKYELKRVLGEGAFGITRKAIRKVATSRGTVGGEVAVKSIAKSKLTTPEAIQDVQREIEVMHHLMGHPNVVQLEEVLEDAKHVHIVMEICKGGNLYQYILNRGEYKEGDVAALMQIIMEVVAHCHAMNVLHRDIKPENFLLLTPPAPGPGGGRAVAPVLKATDFGLSTFLTKPSQTFAEVVGTCYYIAPEVLRRDGGQAADIWSAGIVMYVLLCGRPPFTGTSEEQVFKAVLETEPNLTEKPWNIVSAPCKALLRRMLQRDPARRPTAQQVLQDPWLAKGGHPLVPFEPEVLRRLKNFAATNMLKKAALLWMSANSDEGELERAGLDAMFDDMDTDRDRMLSPSELTTALQQRGSNLPLEGVTGLLEKLDMNRDGMVSRSEFVAAGMHLMRTKSKSIREAFRHFDQDGDNLISPPELQDALKEYGASDVREMMDGVDKNNDGMIDYQEFADLLRTPAA